MKENKPDDPVDIGLFRANAVMPEPHDFPNSIEQFLGLRCACFVDILLPLLHNRLHSRGGKPTDFYVDYHNFHLLSTI